MINLIKSIEYENQLNTDYIWTKFIINECYRHLLLDWFPHEYDSIHKTGYNFYFETKRVKIGHENYEIFEKVFFTYFFIFNKSLNTKITSCHELYFYAYKKLSKKKALKIAKKINLAFEDALEHYKEYEERKRIEKQKILEICSEVIDV